MGAVLDYLLPRNPVTGNRQVHLIPSWIERSIGESSYISLVTKSGGEVDKTNYSQYVSLVESVGQQLATYTKRKDLKFEFKVINSDENNAWCLPGGKIGINIGLIKNMENEAKFGSFTLDEKVAAVLSHEIIHADARHTGRSLEIRLFFIGIVKAAQAFALHFFVSSSYQTKIEEARKANKPVAEITRLEKEKNDRVQQVGALFELISGWIIDGLNLCNSRSHELESDRYGMLLMFDAGIKPAAAIWLQEFFNTHHQGHDHKSLSGKFLNLFSTHPAPGERLEANRKTLEEINKAPLK